jgi:hypothetical protein
MGKNQTAKNTQSNQDTVEVLYQKMGDRWFAFSLVGDDVFVGSLTQDEVEGKTARTNRVNNDGFTGKKIGHS